MSLNQYIHQGHELRELHKCDLTLLVNNMALRSLSLSLFLFLSLSLFVSLHLSLSLSLSLCLSLPLPLPFSLYSNSWNESTSWGVTFQPAVLFSLLGVPPRTSVCTPPPLASMIGCNYITAHDSMYVLYVFVSNRWYQLSRFMKKPLYYIVAILSIATELLLHLYHTSHLLILSQSAI